MKFSIQSPGKLGGRLGLISFDSCSGGMEISTPFSLTTTRVGQVPHLTPSCLEMIGFAPQVLQVPLDSQLHLHTALQATTSNFRTLAGHRSGLVYSCILNPLVDAPPGYNIKKEISVWPKSCRAKVDPTSFVEVQSSVSADWVELMCDWDTPTGASNKRVLKSLDRTGKHVDVCLRRIGDDPRLRGAAIFGPLVGGYDADQRRAAARHLVTSHGPQLAGYVLEGLAAGPTDVQAVAQIDQIADLCTASLTEVPADRPRVLHGPWRPLHVLQLVAAGVDVFDSSYPSLATERSAALVFPLADDVMPDPSDRTGVSCDEEATRSAYQLDMNNTKYAVDNSPLVDKCKCHTCSNFSRAYIHHLVQVKEMLAAVLLSIHNLHHWQLLFASIRRSVELDSVQAAISLYRQLEEDATRSR